MNVTSTSLPGYKASDTRRQ